MITDVGVGYIATSFGVVGVVWAIAFIVYIVCKYNKLEE